MKKRIISTILILVMVISLIPHVAFAAETTTGSIKIDANSGTQTLSITASDPGDVVDASGDLVLTAGTYSIDRDYAQSVIVEVENTSTSPVEYYLVSDNQYDDIFMNFVKSGSEDAPLVILPGETQDIELSIFAQNATRSTYKIPVYVYIIKDGETSPGGADTITLNCTLPTFNVSFTLDNSDPATLTKTYTIRNNGTSLITDLTLSLTGEAESYARISPAISNYELDAGQMVTFKLIPDLSKMNATSRTQVLGELVAQSVGLSISESVIFDTLGATITTTTMGDLALIQDGNPYYNLRIDEASISSFATINGTNIDVVELGNTLDVQNNRQAVEDFIDQLFDVNNNYEFNISESVDFTYGPNGDVIHTTISIASRSVTGRMSRALSANSSYSFDPITGTLTFYNIETLSFSEYESLYAEALRDIGNTLDIPNVIYKTFAPDGNVTSYEVEVKKEIVKEAWKGVTENTVLEEVGYFSKGFKTAGDVIKVDSVLASPNYTNELKGWYTGLSVVKNVFRWAKGPSLAHPLAFLVVVAGEYCVDRMIGDLEDIMKMADGSALYYDIYGRQCTNVGKVTSNFYVPDYVADSPDMYETGRMYDGSYVNSTDTNYSYYLNGQRAGSSHNTGLTEVSIAKIPTDNLKPGSNNVIVRDYDTNPGTHFVTADSEITIIYPSDTEISYIGNPDTLEEVRLLPDFAVYTENIFTDGDSIIGETNQISANINNRGSLGGWVDINISDGLTTLYSEENYFIDAFSSIKASCNWTPAVASTNIIVTLVNKTVDIPERKSDNNSATHTFIARARQVPVIVDIAPTTTVQDSEMLFIANITDIADLESVSFVVDSTTYSGSSVSIARVSGNEIRASVRVPILTADTHTVKAVAEYYTGKTTTSAIDKSQSVTVTELTGIDFTTDATIVNPAFYIVRQSGSYLYDVNVSVKSNGGNSYTLVQNSTMSATPAGYYLLVKCNAGLALASISTLSGTELSLTGGKMVSINKGSAEISSVYVGGINGYSLSQSSISFGTVNELVFSTSITDVDINISYSVNSMSGYAYEDVVLDGNKAINLNDYYKIYQFTLNDISSSGYYYFNPQLRYVPSGSIYGSTTYPSSSYNSATKQLTLLVSGSYQVDRINNAQSAKVYFTSNDTLYIVDVLDYSSPITLSKSSYNKISYSISGGGAFSVQNTSVSIDSYSYSLSGNEIYVPAGSYNISTYYTVDISKLQYYGSVNVSTNTTVELPGKPVGALTTVSFRWPAIYSQAQMSYQLSGSVWSVDIPINQSEQIIMPVGPQNVRVYLNNSSPSYSYLYVDVQITTIADDNVEVVIGDNFSGSANIYGSPFEGRNQCTVYLSNLLDADSNELTSYYSSSYDGILYGTVTLTNKANPLDIHTIVVSSTSINSLSFTLPNVTGEYYYSVSLSTDKKEIEITPNEYNIVATAETGGSITPSGIIKVTEGGSQTFTISPANGYAISSVLVDSVSIGAVNTYTFSNVTNNHTIVAKFKSTQNSDYSDYQGEGYYRSPTSVTTAPEDEEVATTDTITKEPATGKGFTARLTKSRTYSGNTFSDTMPGAWYTDAIKFVYEYGVMNGVSATEFGPNYNTTRAQIITILARLSGLDTEGGETWYSKAVEWALQNGISDGTNLMSDVTREQLVTMMWRFAGEPKVEISVNFTDSDQISSWALDAMKWAISIGLITGYPDGSVNPGGSATRAEIATIIKRYMES